MKLVEDDAFVYDVCFDDQVELGSEKFALMSCELVLS